MVRKAAYRGDHDGSVKVALALGLGPVQAVEDLAGVCGKGSEDLGAVSTHCHEAD